MFGLNMKAEIWKKLSDSYPHCMAIDPAAEVQLTSFSKTSAHQVLSSRLLNF